MPADRINAANDEINKWQWPDLCRFKSNLIGEANLSADENIHRHAVFEYYHALWLEQNSKFESRKHFEESFNQLRFFQDPLAQMITAYFLYRTNSFAIVSPLIPFTHLRRVVEFLGQSSGNPGNMLQITIAHQSTDFVPFEIAIADADEAVFASVSSALSRDYSTALQYCTAADERTPSGDDQARHRIKFLRHRIHILAGQLREARLLAEQLLRCGVVLFAAEAKEFLQKH